MDLSVITPNCRLFSGSITSINLPGSKGGFQVFANHAPIVSSLQRGNVVYTVGNDRHTIAIKQGFVAVVSNQVTVVCEPFV